MTEPPVAESYSGRRRAKGGRLVHATRAQPNNGVAYQVAACGKRAEACLPEPRTAPVTCNACRAITEQTAVPAS